MRPRFSLIVTLFAWLLATGSHWDLVQTYAWGSMIAEYSRDMSFASAVKKTFSAETMCHLCHAVADAKKAADGNAATPGTKTLGKILLVAAPPSSTFLSPVALTGSFDVSERTLLSAQRPAPPVPPPRQAV